MRNGLITLVECLLWLHYPWDLLWWAIGRYRPPKRFRHLIRWLEAKRTDPNCDPYAV
jgi:hypothetical protein